MLNKILDEAERFRSIIALLKKESPRYPQFLRKEIGPQVFFSTLVRIEREGIWYLVHCVESYNPDLGIKTTDMDLIKKFMTSAYVIQNLYKISGTMEDIDPVQTPESELLRQWLQI